VKALRELLTMPSSTVTLDVAALDLASIEHPDLDPTLWLHELDRLAMELAGRAGDLSDGFNFLQSANRFLFEELGFHGNETDYYDPRNSCLNDVLAYRTGIPITLSLVYMEIARRLAKSVTGIGAPGHFLIRYDDPRLSVYIDAFNGGRLLNSEQCLRQLGTMLAAPLDQSALAPVSSKQLMIRMLRNLQGAYVRRNSFEKALQVSDLLQLAGPSGTGFMS
jgi:regulator of sirC expression with transglutaminase-like and TPR domain